MWEPTNTVIHRCPQTSSSNVVKSLLTFSILSLKSAFSDGIKSLKNLKNFGRRIGRNSLGVPCIKAMNELMFLSRFLNMKMCRTSGRPRTTSPVRLTIMLAVFMTTVSTSGLKTKQKKIIFNFYDPFITPYQNLPKKLKYWNGVSSALNDFCETKIYSFLFNLPMIILEHGSSTFDSNRSDFMRLIFF